MAAGALVAVAADLLALCLVESPGAAGADVVVGNTQRFGVPLGFGGPHAAYIATREDYKRSLPGRLVGVSKDAHGRAALRLALQTREQHIRREKATSNICTAQVLLAVIAGFYGVYHGPDGLAAIARRVHAMASALAAALSDASTANGQGADGPATGISVLNTTWFDTLTVSAPGQAEAIAKQARQRRINLRVIDDNTLGISVDETTTETVLADVLASFGVAATPTPDTNSTPGIPAQLQRQTPFMEHPVFHSHHSEVALTRYMRRLADRDIALDKSMIPLGSCTMKLNAATEMAAVTWPEFANIHPFAPRIPDPGLPPAHWRTRNLPG